MRTGSLFAMGETGVCRCGDSVVDSVVDLVDSATSAPLFDTDTAMIDTTKPKFYRFVHFFIFFTRTV
jgi:hypothetical protein